MNRLQKYYENIVTSDLLLKDHYVDVMQLPQLTKITLNTGIGLKAILDKKQILTALLSMQLISGQRPVITRAKKSIDKFKLRVNMPIGCKVTLRKSNLFEFMDRFINIILPVMDSSNDLFSSRCSIEHRLRQKASSRNQYTMCSMDLAPPTSNGIQGHSKATSIGRAPDSGSWQSLENSKFIFSFPILRENARYLQNKPYLRSKFLKKQGLLYLPYYKSSSFNRSSLNSLLDASVTNIYFLCSKNLRSKF